MAKTEYDQIAGEYKESKLLGFRQHIEAHTLFELMGNLNGKKVLDLACGEGIYTRKIKRAGADKAVGVDLSTEMIRLAEGEEKRNPLGCTYYVSDVARLGPLDEFDIVVGSYLLNYSTTKEELADFARAIYNNLKPGGHFIGFNNNPADFTHSDSRYRSYGFTKHCPNGHKDGDPIVYTFYNEDGSVFQLENYFLKPELHKDVFEACGFSSFHWKKALLSRDGKTSFPETYWDEFLTYQPVCGLVAIK